MAAKRRPLAADRNFVDMMAALPEGEYVVYVQKITAFSPMLKREGSFNYRPPLPADAQWDGDIWLTVVQPHD